MSHKLMIKTHNVTALKYLCYTQKDGDQYNGYLGSGKAWLQHIKEHGNDITTTLIFETEDKEEFKKEALRISKENDIIASNLWANQSYEQGSGGNTVSNKIWITDGLQDKYHDKHISIPEGWKKGRTNCVFNDSAKQKQFSKKAKKENRSNGVRKAWQEGKFTNRNKPGVSGDNNPAKRPEVREKIRQAALSNSSKTSERMKAKWQNVTPLSCPYCGTLTKTKRWHFDNCRNRK